MSGFFGIINRNGKLVNEDIVNTMLDVMSSWNPDERNIYMNGPVALGHTMLWNTPESKYEHLPLKKDTCILTMDARIDNRDELIKELVLPDCPLDEIGDSEFILAAYEKWGEECPKYLLGDFSFAIWDEKKQYIFCARDHVGIKPFYYYLDDDIFVFSNDIEPIVSVKETFREINDYAIINFFRFRQLKHPTVTFFKDIVKLEAATTMIVKFKSKIQTKYWDINKIKKINFDSEEKYIQRLQDLLIQSIACRIRSEYPIASHLSGGLDSSSIAIIASRLLGELNKKLYAYNWLHSPTEKENKEDFDFSMSYEIAKKENIKHKYIDFSVNDALDLLLNHDIRFNDTINFWYEHFVRKEATKNKVRTIISGWGGDELISYNGFGYVTGLFWKKHLIKAYKILDEYNKKNGRDTSKLKLFYKVFRLTIRYSHLPRFPRNWYYKLVGRERKQFDYGQILKNDYKEYRKKFNFNKNKISNSKGLHLDQISLYNNGHLLTRIESWASGGIRNNINYYYPLLDKRIIEFALAIPEKYYFIHGEGRYIFKKALEGILPKKLLVRDNTKYEPNRLRVLTSMEKEIVNRWKESIDFKIFLEKSKYIDEDKIHEVIHNINLNNKEEIDDFLDIIMLVILLTNTEGLVNE